MSAGRIRWLYGELPGLVERGVLGPDVAEAIRGHYGPVPEISGRRILLVTFGALGALLIGAGIILVFGHNWDELTRLTRAALCIALVLVGQCAAAYAAIRKPDSAAWSEGAGGFLPMALLASLALLAQTYHVAGEPRGLLGTTIALSLPVAYLLRSRVAMALCWVLATNWFLLEPWPDESVRLYLGFGAFVAACAPFLAWTWVRHREDPRTPLLGWVVGGSIVIAMARPADLTLAAPLFAGLLATLYVLGRGVGDGSAAWRRPWLAIGALGLGVTLVVCGFQGSWDHLGRLAGEFDSAAAKWIAALALALVVIPMIGGIRAMRNREIGPGLLAFTPVIVLVAWVASTAWTIDPLAPAVLINLWALAAGLAVCIEGARAGRLGTANAGLLLMLAILMTRFFDVDISFLGRGLAFIVMGAGFLGMNVRMLRQRKEVRS